MKKHLSDIRLTTSVWQLLQQIDNTAGQALTLAEQLEKVADLLIEALDVDAIWLLTISPLSPVAVGTMRTPLTVAPKAKVRALDNAPSLADGWPDSDTLLGQAIARKTPLFIEPEQAGTTRTYSDLGDVLFNTIGVVPSAIVPMVTNDTPLGILVIGNKTDSQVEFSPESRDFLAYLGKHMARTLLGAHLVEDTQTHSDTEVINEITAIINAGHGLSETGQLIFKQFHRLFAFDHISISLLDGSKTKIRQWTLTEHGSIENTKQLLLLDNSALARIIETGQAYAIDDITTAKPAENQAQDRNILRLDGVRSVVVSPLISQAKPYGSLTLGHRQAGLFGQAELQLLEQLSPQLSIAIDKALLIDEMEQRTTELQLLNRLSEMLVSTTDIRLIVDTTLNMLPRLLPADFHGVVIAGEDGAYAGIAVPYGFNREKRTTKEMFDTFLEMSDGPEQIELIWTKCVPGNMPVSADWEPVTVHSLPILTGQGARGLIYLASGKHESYDDKLLHIFSLIVSQISAAIANAQLFQQVEQERARLAAILASITDAVLVVNRNGRIVLDNPAARELLSASESQSGRLLAETTNLETLIDLFKSAMQGGKPTGEFTLVDGRTFFANLSPVSIGRSDVVGWVATMQDVSHFKELNQLKSDFVSSVSHDLKSPLSSILLAINLVAEAGTVSQGQQELINTVDRQVRAMGQLIDDILDVGKIEADIDMEMEPCQLGPIIGDVVEALRAQAADKAIDVTACLAEDLPFVLANGLRLRQVFYNLVGNAIKYTAGPGKVLVEGYHHENELRIKVVDTGVGIPPGDQPHIFEKFYRVKGDYATQIKGTGLGLAISKGIVEKHHGRIWLESVFGEGSTFTVALPIYSQKVS